MFEALNEIDTQWFYWINQHHCSAMDWAMWGITQHWAWLIAIVLFFSLTTLRRETHRWWLVLAGIGICFLLADQGTVHLFKETFCRLRPCHALENVRMFRTNCGGQYGFVSSHAANAFAITAFLWLRYRRWEGHSRKAALAVPILVLIWALATCYSRPYLGKHYPGDMIFGAIFGILMGLISWYLISWIEKYLKKSETKS